MTTETIVQVRWSDMDAMGHVNNAAYLTYLETAREPWFAALGADDELHALRDAAVEIDYLSQLTLRRRRRARHDRARRCRHHEHPHARA